ncbi:glycoside hydrolase, partial [Tothia fuscella]
MDAGRRGAMNDSERTMQRISQSGTQQQPEARIDIIGLSEQYILGQISSNVSQASNQIVEEKQKNTTLVLIQKQLNKTSFSTADFVQNIVQADGPTAKPSEGPIQCGPNQPCLDGSCCNKEGKCGYKLGHCAPENCLSNCKAKAMCGMDSVDGATPCGLKLCCSFYGWCGTEDAQPQFGRTPCQEGYGSCEITAPPQCGPGSGTSKKRRVGYYQGWNTRERKCDKVSPRQINTRGITHLFYSFAFFHPTTFEITPMHEGDVALYKEFTDLKTNTLQTWIAIGGWSFNDPGPQQHAYSDMVSTKSNRSKFIQSLIKFMDKYAFQGADLDWEYPVNETRGGRKEDTENLVLLVKEMKEQFGGRYGNSIVLAPDYWYLRGFKPAEMQEHVDFMGFMAYDLHGPWDTDVKTLGSRVRPHTDAIEIAKNLKPLWFDGVDPAKINLGMAYYGRTYKLSDPSCDKMGCTFVPQKGGAPGECTNYSGILSNREIRKIQSDKGITPYLNSTAMVKYFTYEGDSWVGYDDADTFKMKASLADDLCLGGLMIWSVDFDDEVG